MENKTTMKLKTGRKNVSINPMRLGMAIKLANDEWHMMRKKSVYSSVQDNSDMLDKYKDVIKFFYDVAQSIERDGF